ncbi:MAG: hypothetical protein ACE5HS_05230 [bacterium]
MKLTIRKFLLIAFLVLIAGSLLYLQSFNESKSEETGGNHDAYWPTRSELHSKLREIRKELLVYGTNRPEASESYKRFAENYSRRSRWLEIVVKPDSAVTEAEISSLPLWLVGTPASNSVLSRITSRLPLKIEKHRFVFGDFIYDHPTDVFVISSYPNPLNRKMALSVVSGNRDEHVADFLFTRNRRYMRAGDIRVFREGQGVAFSFFKQENNQPWQIDWENSRNYLNLARTVFESEHFVFTYHGDRVPEQSIQQFSQKQERRLAKLLQNLSTATQSRPSFPKINCQLYESMEDKGLMTGNTDLSHFDLDKWQVHLIFNEDLKGDDFYSEAGLLCEKYLGKTSSPALRDGLAMYFSENWAQKGYRYWSKLFYEIGQSNSLNELLDANIYRQESYLFMRPQAGSFVGFLVDKYPWPKFVKLYSIWPARGLPKPLEKEIELQSLEKAWLNYLDAMEVKTSPAASRPQKQHPTFQKGFCYAHEGYQIYNGYLSRKSAASLNKLCKLGADWISLTPFGYLAHRNQPSYFRFSFGAGSENDESLIVAARAAEKLGMGVMLKPHVLMHSMGWGWPGDVQMLNETDWQLFFSYYSKWIRHYALLAEIYDIDMFSIGVELMQTTRDHAENWRQIIKMVRQIYHGPLVYAANWYQEFEQITFWDELDYIGLNLYYPLSQKDTVTVAELKHGMATGLPIVEKVVQKYKKPLLLTEVGFTSSPQSWKVPHERKRRTPVNLEHQALAYQAIFESFWDKEWFYGFYWWKWPTYLEDGGEYHNGFTPNGKPAEKVVQQWYSKR